MTVPRCRLEPGESVSACPGRSAACNDALQTQDRQELGAWGGTASAMHRKRRCIACGTQAPQLVFGHFAVAIARSVGYTVIGLPFCHCTMQTGALVRRPA